MGSTVNVSSWHDYPHHRLRRALLPSQHRLNQNLLHSNLLAQLGNLHCALLVELEPAGPAAEALEQEAPATLTEGETEECFPDEVVTDASGDGQLV